MVRKYNGQTHFWSRKFFGPKNILGRKFFVQIILWKLFCCIKKNFVQHIFWSKTIVSSTKFWSRQIFWSEKILVKKFLVEVNIWPKKIWVQHFCLKEVFRIWSKKCLVQKIFGQNKIFGLKKFLVQTIFGPEKFRSKMLLVQNIFGPYRFRGVGFTFPMLF